MIAEQLAQAHARIAELESENIEIKRDLRRYENARVVLCAEIDHLRSKIYGRNTHPDAIRCGCDECNS